MSIHCFTSFSFSYLSKARVLASTLKQHNPHWVLWAVITDREPKGFKFDLSKENFDYVIWAEEIYGSETLSWILKHNIVEACTAVKGRALQIIFEAGAEKVFFLDPDIAVFAPLDPLETMLDRGSILLTPHQITPETTEIAIRDNEICSLRHGIYNLGFVGVRNDDSGRSFSNWWEQRLRDYCFENLAEGIFVDQKWCDLVPALFDNVVIIRDPGYNVASWNLSNRKLLINNEGEILVNGVPLRFYHFTKLGPIGETMTQRYAGDNSEVYELWSWYKNEVQKNEDASIPPRWWHYNQLA
jgi:hypothetical protein